MKRSMQLFTFSLLIISLGGCAYQAPKDINSTYYAPPVGSSLLLNSAITIPANDAHARIQNGKVVTSYWMGVDAYYPNCSFELYSRAEVERVIEPDTFIITRVVRETENVRLQLPAVVASGGVAGGGVTDTESITIMNLKSDKQPEVMRMSCQHWDDPNEATHLNIKQIRKTLDPLFTLTLSGR